MLFSSLSAPHHAPHHALEACVIVPAKNEAAVLESTLAALARQVDLQGQPLRREQWEVLLLINNSRDRSFAIASQFRQNHPRMQLHVAECHFGPKEAHIGHVRKLLMDLACERLMGSASAHALILSTDADTEAAPDWIAQNMAEARRGADAIGGRITLQLRDVCQFDTRTRQIHHLSDEFYLLVARLESECDSLPHDPWPRHHQHFGGSLAVRPAVYRQVGGLPPRRALEDLALYEALVRHDRKVRHSPAVQVRTSGRLKGRTEVGLAEQLSCWSRQVSTVLVPSVELYTTLFSIRRRVRTAWQRSQDGDRLTGACLESLSMACGASPYEMREALARPWFGYAFETLAVQTKLESGSLPHELPRGRALQPLQNAVAALEARFRASPQRYASRLTEEVQSGIAAL